MPLNQYPGWAELDNVNALEGAVGQLIADYARVNGNEDAFSMADFNKVATAVLANIYPSLEAQFEATVNARAYAAS